MSNYYDNLKVGDKIRVLFDGVEPQDDGTYKDLTKQQFTNNEILKANGVGYDARYTDNDAFGDLYDIVIALYSSTSSNFELEVTKGNVAGHSVIDKFGLNPLITPSSDPEDVWEGGGTYTYDANGTAPIVSIASNNAADTQEVIVTGADIDGNEVEQTLTLNGTTRVALTTPLWRVYRIENNGNTNLAGVVFVYTGTGLVPSVGDPEVRAIVDNGNNQTLMSLYTIPLGKVGFLYRGELGLEFSGSVGAGTQFARCYYKSRRVGKIFKVKKSISLVNLGSSTFQDKRSFPDIIPALTDIKIVAAEVSDDMGIWATFDILLVDEDQFTQEYLDKIGQPSVMPT